MLMHHATPSRSPYNALYSPSNNPNKRSCGNSQKVPRAHMGAIRVKGAYNLTSQKSSHPPTFGPIPGIGSKFTIHPKAILARLIGALNCWLLRSTVSSTLHIWGKKVRVILRRRLLQGSLCMYGQANPAHFELRHAHNYMVLLTVLCTTRTWLWSCWRLFIVC